MGNAAARPGAELLDVGRGAGELGGCDHLHGLPLGGEAVSGARSSYEASGGLGDECSASRVGFWIEPGCRLTSSGFLPPALAPSGVGVDSCRMVLSDSQPGFVAEVGGRWYSGSLLSSSVRTERSPSSSGTYRFSEHTWYSATITPAPDPLVYP